MRKLILLTLLAATLYSNQCNSVVLDLKIDQPSVKLISIIENIAKECEYSIFYEEGGESILTKKTGIISLKNRTPKELIDFLLSKHNFNYTLEDDILTISKYKIKTFKVDFLNSPRRSTSNMNVAVGGSGGVKNNGQQSTSNGNTGAEIKVSENFDFWDGIEKDIKGVLGDNERDIIINRNGGLITLKGKYKELKRVETYLNNLLKTLKKQVVIDVKVISVTLDKSNKVGIDWSQLSASYNSQGATTDTTSSGTTTGAGLTEGTFSSAAKAVPGTNSWVVAQSSFKISGFLNFLRSYGETKSLSNPKVLAMNNQPSLISVGDNINYGITTSTSNDSTVSTSTELRELFVGVLLDITPKIDDRGYVTLRINPSISDFKFAEDATSKTNRTLPPDTVSRRISTVARVKNEDVVILGGLINNTKSKTTNKVWLLGDIPFLGWLFKSDNIKDITTEIVFVLTPKIVEEEKPLNFKDLGFTQIEEEKNND
ncbi:MAG: pilus (MSHA type) biogenesis protein MshL [Campylobacterales bacterium]|nr:pilus (MSHA type) biogenesis protein MshL [Campylobacterales bacterium]